MRSAVKVQWGTSARLVLAGSRGAKLVQVLEGLHQLALAMASEEASTASNAK
ncbi:hypothetical protein PF005_g24883 [Phytophthora fragariae]|uniref:Uncharacterized protein n=1 Tax=Phytophthora fragariae TaxID=53985 RepID=A0A6A3W5W2_9STRA|nr:hypothetical protein PF003_g16410 [Phytophthora fragariae]KAE8936020.1 hypothetical protein PF009_g14044 [Phytophthora fragariae]KAE8960944.1 hypothetical protein PF011_g29927 [Phytophthora fragariae]KAE9075119.1 hypothetical protein PF010_g24432 [Phytophthora fragariae]KAE9107709.1 hypothetical protein PF007_g12939 [Phytophthora fragariae]